MDLPLCGFNGKQQIEQLGICQASFLSNLSGRNALPEGYRFKGYKDFVVQDIVIEARELRFRMKYYQTPDGKTVAAALPKKYRGKHFSPELISYCLELYHSLRTTEPLLLKHLHEQGIKISAGQLHAILKTDLSEFSNEVEALRQAGIQHASYLHSDDTGSRHKGKNETCTCVSSPHFTYFSSNPSKSRLNFLQILRGKQSTLYLNDNALLYAFERGLNDRSQDILEAFFASWGEKRFGTEASYRSFLRKQGIRGKAETRILVEAGVFASAMHHGLPEGLPILSDAAGQFCIGEGHALCWVHEERHYRKLVPVDDEEAQVLNAIRSDIWDLYEKLKAFRKDASESRRQALFQRFDAVFAPRKGTARLNKLLAQSRKRRQGLLQVLNYPYLPLHNNDCERDIREYVIRRKISSTTRSTTGKLARDTFLSLYKSCSKLGLSFAAFLRDRLQQIGEIPPLPQVLIEQARAGP